MLRNPNSMTKSELFLMGKTAYIYQSLMFGSIGLNVILLISMLTKTWNYKDLSKQRCYGYQWKGERFIYESNFLFHSKSPSQCIHLYVILDNQYFFIYKLFWIWVQNVNHVRSSNSIWFLFYLSICFSFTTWWKWLSHLSSWLLTKCT